MSNKGFEGERNRFHNTLNRTGSVRNEVNTCARLEQVNNNQT